MTYRVLTYKPHILSRTRTLAFSQDELNIHAGNRLELKIPRSNINSIRHGLTWIKGAEFTIGRLLTIDIGNQNTLLHRIKLQSFYGIKIQKTHVKYGQILNALYDFYLDDLIGLYLTQIQEGEIIQLANVAFSIDGVSLFVNKKDISIKWEDVKTNAYTYYYAISSKSKPEQHQTFNYLSDWNATLVYSISRGILSNKGLYTE